MGWRFTIKTKMNSPIILNSRCLWSHDFKRSIIRKILNLFISFILFHSFESHVLIWRCLPKIVNYDLSRSSVKAFWINFLNQSWKSSYPLIYFILQYLIVHNLFRNGHMAWRVNHSINTCPYVCFMFEQSLHYLMIELWLPRFLLIWFPICI